MRSRQDALTEDDVGFMLAPRVNAASRMGDPKDAFALFTTEDAAEAERLAKLLEKSNRQRKAEAGAITRAVHARLKGRELPSVIALGDPDWRPALLGLVAGGIAEEYERPVFLWGREGSGALKGSVRSAGVHALMLMEAAGDVFTQFGGHAASGGFTVRDDLVFALEEKLGEALARISKGYAQEESLALLADAELSPDEVDFRFLRKLERLAPFGQENPKPIFLIRGAYVSSAERFGKGSEHVKLVVASDDTGKAVEAVMFFAKKEVARIVDALAAGSRADMLAHVERDPFSRKYPVRLRLLDLKLV
jgi:single-stranded-DNA-specific exonuclease